MKSDRPTISPKTTRKIEHAWKTLTMIGAIAAAGFAASTYLTGFKTEKDAEADHDRINGAINEVSKAADVNSENIQEVRYINVRIEVNQDQLNKRLDRNHAQVRAQSAKTRAERRRAEEEVRVLDLDIQRTQAAIDRSYEVRPMVPRRSNESPIPLGDPLSQLEGL